MRSRSRNQTTLTMEATVLVRLSDEDRAAKGHRSAVIGHSIRAYKRKLAYDSRATKEAIKKLEKERDDIDDALVRDEELRAQGDLRFEGKKDATEVLAQVAKRTARPEKCPGCGKETHAAPDDG